MQHAYPALLPDPPPISIDSHPHVVRAAKKPRTPLSGIRGFVRKQTRENEGFGKRITGCSLCLGDLACFDGLDADQHPLDLAAWQNNADPLKVRTKLPLCDFGHVRADAAALFRLPLAVDDAALDRALPCDLTNSGHFGNGKMKRNVAISSAWPVDASFFSLWRERRQLAAASFSG